MDVKDLYLEGKTISEIARVTGISRRTIRRSLIKLDITPIVHHATKLKVICLTCKKEFIISEYVLKWGRGRFCSKKCYINSPNIHVPKLQVKRVIVSCLDCGKEIKTTQNRIDTGHGKFCTKTCWNHYYRVINSHLPKNITDIEKIVRDALTVLKVPFEFQYEIDRYICDFVLPQYKIVIECDGLYWHALPKTKARDKIKDKYLKSQGWLVIRLKGTDIKNDLTRCLTRISTNILLI